MKYCSCRRIHRRDDPSVRVHFLHDFHCAWPGVFGRNLSQGIPPVKVRGPQDVIHVVLGGLEATQGFASMPAVGVGSELSISFILLSRALAVPDLSVIVFDSSSF
jgi:hypothetical protein